jgi:hypothetical protein
MRQSMLGGLVGAAALAATQVASGAHPCPYSDLMPAYEQFATRTANLEPEARATAFIHEIATRYPDYYAPEVYGDEAKLQRRAVQFFDPTKRASVFPGVQLTDAHLAEMGRIIGPEFLRQQRKFIRTFKDFSCAATVEFGVSLFKFDGHPAEFGGQEHMLFGVDLIAALHAAADMSAFFDHEIFHLYHKPLIASQLPQGEDPAWVTLWTEGLATYVSQRMNPQLDAQQVLWFPRDIVARMKTEAPRAARLLLRDLEKTGHDADRWFYMGTQVEGLPDRAGYYLGYLFAKSIGDDVELPTLARMPLAEIHERERAFLTSLAGPGE